MINAYSQMSFIKQAYEYGNINILKEYFELILMVNVLIIKYIVQFIYLYMYLSFDLTVCY